MNMALGEKTLKIIKFEKHRSILLYLEWVK
jgi:hypothetical protein